MNDHPARAEKVPRPASGTEPNRYAITLAALLATPGPGSGPGRGTTRGTTP